MFSIENSCLDTWKTNLSNAQKGVGIVQLPYHEYATGFNGSLIELFIFVKLLFSAVQMLSHRMRIISYYFTSLKLGIFKKKFNG